MTATTVDLHADRPLHDLLSLYHSGDGVDALRELAVLRVRELEPGDAKVLGRSLSDWATADVADELRKAFELDPFKLLAQAWGQVRKVRKGVQASLGPPPLHETVRLGTHEVEAAIEPRLVLAVDGIDWCEVKLTLALKFGFDSVEIDLQGGAIVALRTGKPTGQVLLKCQGQEIAAFKRSLKLQAAYTFRHPLALARPAAGPIPA